MRRVLVTGASGFIGRQTLKPLVDRGFEVLALAHQTQPVQQSGVKWRSANLLEPGLAERIVSEFRPSHLLHLAWYMAPQDYRNSPENIRWCGASIELLRAFAVAGGQRAVACGTCFEYDARFGYCSEHLTPALPSTLYGVCKNSLREMALGFAKLAGISLAWGRAFFLYGPYEAPARLVPSVLTSLLRQQPARCSHGEQVRDFLYVRDAGEAFVSILDSDLSGIVNVASGNPVKLKDIIYLLADQVGAREMVRLGALPASQDDPPLLVANIRRLQDEAKWSPATPLEQGLQETVRWWRDIGLREKL
jgi:nucleoside-diphosphate-sugar epimerase